MRSLLYLDTARLGLMSRRARGAMYSLHRFASEEGISPRFHSLLQDGFDAWPACFRRRYQGLADWKGMTELHDAFKAVLTVPTKGSVLIAGRSAEMMRLAAHNLFLHCDRVLVTDLEWPGYLSILARAAANSGKEIVRVAVRSAILEEGASKEEVVTVMRSRYVASGCDGLFLAAVNNLGVRFPLEELHQAVCPVRPPKFVVVDGAQAFCHTQPPADLGWCDMFLAGCHKWLRAYHPMGLAFCPRLTSRRGVEAAAGKMRREGSLQDALFGFCQQLRDRACEPFSETVDLANVFAARAAVQDFLEMGDREAAFATLLRNRNHLAEAVDRTGWHALQPAVAFRSGILLLRAASQETRRAPPEELSSRLRNQGIAGTAYSGGVLRLSMPLRPWRSYDLHLMRTVLNKCS